jgi:hypothetical protein
MRNLSKSSLIFAPETKVAMHSIQVSLSVKGLMMIITPEEPASIENDSLSKHT